MSDKNWKMIIEELFYDFCYFFLPELAKLIDFTQPYEFLDKELSEILPKSEENTRYLDKLIKIFLKDGQEKWILIHTEVQGYEDDHFSERMFIYFYRIFDKFKKKIVALAIFTDEKRDYKPYSFYYDYFGTTLNYSYKTYKVIEQEEEKLLKTENPFGLVILASKYALATKKEEKKRLEFKKKLIHLLLERGYKKGYIRNLFVFIDEILKLQDIQLQLTFYEEIKKIKGGKIMETMGDFEEVVFRKGVQQGVQQGINENIKKLLLKGLDKQKIADLLDLDIKCIEAVEKENGK